MEQLLQSDDATLKNQPLAILPLCKLDWEGREVLFVQSLARDLPELRHALLRDQDVLQTMARASIGLPMMQPAIELFERGLGARDERWLHYQFGNVVAHLGDVEVQALCLDALVHGSKRLRQWVKEHYISASAHLTSDALDDEMIAALLADLNVPGRISEHFYNPLGLIATHQFVQERLLPLAQGASGKFRENLALVLKEAGNRHGRRYLLTTW